MRGFDQGDHDLYIISKKKDIHICMYIRRKGEEYDSKLFIGERLIMEIFLSQRNPGMTFWILVNFSSWA